MEAEFVHPLVINTKNSEKNHKTIFSLISKLINQPDIEKGICRQFFDSQGLQVIKSNNLLNVTTSSSSGNKVNIVDILSILCQFCRINRRYYPHIHELNIYEEIKNCFHNPVDSKPILLNTILIQNRCQS